MPHSELVLRLLVVPFIRLKRKHASLVLLPPLAILLATGGLPAFLRIQTANQKPK